MSSSSSVRAGALLVLWLASSCGPGGCKDDPDPISPPDPVDDDGGVTFSHRCELNLTRYVNAAGDGSGAAARRIDSVTDLIGGPTAQGRIGDFLLANQKIRLIVQAPDRHIGPLPYGGTILDADIVRPGPGQDQFGEQGLLYNFGRTVDPDTVEVLLDGNGGGPAVVAATGLDTANDYLAIRNQLRNTLGRVPAADPLVPLPLRITSYFILEPDSSRVKVVSALCNTGRNEVVLSVGDLTDPGFGLEFFNGQSCTGGFGYGGVCFGLDRMSWFGFQGSGVAYGYAPYTPGAPTQPEQQNALLTVAGVTGSLLGSPGLQGLAEWFDPSLGQRHGELRIEAGGVRAVARDFYVARDLGEIATLIETSRATITGAPLGSVSGEVRSSAGPVAGARVTFASEAGLGAVLFTDAQGQYQGTLPARSYTASAWAPGRTPSGELPVRVADLAPATLDFQLETPRRLTVSAREVGGGAVPAKVTVTCASGVCPTPASGLARYSDVLGDPLLESIQRVGYIPPSGEVILELPAGEYQLLVSRGPEYSVFPNGYPASGGYPVDLRGGDATVQATLARVLDTPGYMSADFHVHAVNSPDSAVGNAERVLTYAADGVDILVSTDHDFVTDFAPYVHQVGAEPFLATVVGEEVSTMDFGHYNLFPLTVQAESLTGGALDWAGGRGPTFTPVEIFSEARSKGARTIHFNHPRGNLGGLTHLRVDTDTLATHANPLDLGMAIPAGASLLDTRLLSSDFNAIELLNPADDGYQPEEARPRFNDWFVLLSRGLKVAGTGVSDSHTRNSATGWRTFVNVGVDRPEQLDPLKLSDALNAQRAVVSNGPFVQIRAERIDGTGTRTSLPAGMGEVLAASSDDVLVTLDIQTPEYLDVTRIELYMHRPSDDASCPVAPESAQARTTRVACDGVMNRNWPQASITASRSIVLGPASLQVVATSGAIQYRRYKTTQTFRIPRPTTDNWIVAFVYGSKSLFPLLYRPVSAGTAESPVRPFAFTNPIYVDADGNGFDHPPFSAVAQRSLALPSPPAPLNPKPPSLDELAEAWHQLSCHH